ncbi:MAG: diadenylate cyclase, partial [Oscillospiraceae bacterium]|nr:diadenylate cyclase [Oscillospiraceae bacterium]
MITFSELLELIQGFLLTLRQTVNIWDLVDILFVAFLIYRVLSFMRKTSSSSVIKGIALILLVAWLSNSLNMSILNYLLRQVLQLGVIVVVVLFQPELRKMFEQMGASRLIFMFRKRGRFEHVEAGINNVVIASEEMSKNETGALIVFERDIGLNDYAVTGTRIDAYMTSELLQNIFFHNSPLHDGAAIVRDGRLLAAA